MTATRDRRSDPAEDAELAWDDRLILGKSRGWPWWACVALAFGLATVAAVVDMQLQGTLWRIYQIAYILGCVGGVCLVRRRSLFGPIVQPPLVFAVTAVGAVLVFGENTGDGLREQIITIALSLTSNFPTMAIATALTAAVGGYRLWKERDPNPPVRANTQGRQPREPRPPRDPGARRRDRAGRDRVPPGDRQGGARDAQDQQARRNQRGRPARTGSDRRDQASRDRGTSRRDQGAPERGAGDRQNRRSRPRDQDPPPRRRDPADPRPRRDDRPRRDPGDRGNPRQPRRRPPDPHR